MTDSSADRDPLERLAEEFVARFRAGERPSLTEYADRLPERADEVRDLFPALVEMERLKPITGDLTGGYTPSAEPSDPTQLGDFRIIRRVGSGGMGIVYEAVQESLGRHVALKLLPTEALLDPKKLERFRREAKAAAKLHHTNIVPVFGTGEADGRYFYAMQFISGHPLDAVIDEVKRLKEKSGTVVPVPSERAVSVVASALITGTFTGAPDSPSSHTLAHTSAPLAEPSGSVSDTSVVSSPSFSGCGNSYWATVARIGGQIADALEYAHKQGVQHRDIKPANLILDLHGIVWVTDFGLAKSADADNLTQTGDILGTLRYMAPERFEGAGDERADIYALGLTLYELLTLTPAFVASNRAKLVEQVLAANPPRPRSINPAIPRDLETIILKAIARDPAMRYQTAGALAEDLQRYLEDRPVTARRIGPVGQTWRWAKRNPAVASLLTAVFALLATAAAGAVVAAVRIDDARRAADANGEQAGRERDAAEAARTDAQRQVVRLHLSTARQFSDAGDHGAALLWNARAWQEDVSGVDDEAAHRLRLGLSITGQMPLVGLTVADGPLDEALPAAGDRIVTRTWAGVVTVWDGPMRTQLSHPAAATSLAVTADGGTIVTGCADGSARVWEATTGRLVHTVRHGDPVERVSVQPGGGLFAIAGRPAGVSLWNLTTGLRHEPSPEVPGAYYVLFSPDGKSLATADTGGHARGWELATGKPLTPPVPFLVRLPWERRWNGRPGPVFTPDSQRMLVPQSDDTRKRGFLSLWSLTDGTKVWGPILGGAYHHTFSLDGKRLLAAGTTATLHDALTGKQLAVLPTPRECQQAVFVDPQTVLTASTSGLLWEWKVNVTPPARYRRVAQLSDTVPQLTLLSDGRSVLVAGWDGTARRYEVIPKNERKPYEYDCGRADLLRYPDRCYSPDGTTECRFSGDGLPRVGRRGQEPLPIMLATDAPAKAAEFSGDGRSVVTWDGKQVRVWDTAIGAPRGPAVPFTLANSGYSIRLCDDGRRLALGTTDPWTASVYDVATGMLRLEVPLPDVPVESREYEIIPTEIRISPDGRRLVASNGKYAGVFEVWDIDAGVRLSRFQPHRGWNHGHEFSDDGSHILFASSDTTARLWDAAKGIPAGPPLRHTNFLRSSYLTADPRFAVTTTSTGTAYVWNPLTGQSFGSWQAGTPNVWLSRDARRLVGQRGTVVVQAELKPFALPRDQLDPLLHLLTGKRIDPSSDGIEYLPADTIMKDPERYLRAFRAAQSGKTSTGPAGKLESRAPEPKAALELNNTAWSLLVGPPATRDPVRALELVTRAISLEPTNAGYLNTLGVGQYRNSRPAEAIATLTKSLAAGKGTSDGFDLYFLAMSHASLGNLAEAESAFDRAVKWVESQPQLLPNWATELKEFRSEAEQVLRTTAPLPRLVGPPTQEPSR